MLKSDNVIIGLEKPYMSPVFTQYNELKQMEFSPMSAALAHAMAAQERLKQFNPMGIDYLDSDEQIFQNQPIDLIAEESLMSKFPIYPFSSKSFLFRRTKQSLSTNQ